MMMTSLTGTELEHSIETHSHTITRLVDEVEKVVVGQRRMIERLVIGLLTGGHVLLEGAPGLAKTLAVSSLSKAIHASFSRLQFTPDLLPADLVGTQIYHPADQTFSTRKGPIFANLVLADEINRAPAKVQSALLEAMQERQVTIGDATLRLPDPFLVLATQNPIEQEGTYPLPEAQVDRFMLKVNVGYPSRSEERRILDRMGTSRPDLTINAVTSTDEIAQARAIVDRVHVEERVKDYIVTLVMATRDPVGVCPALGGDFDRLIEFGASPRATLALILGARAHAFLNGRAYVSPGDVKAIAPDVLRHRVIPSFEAQAEEITSERIVSDILDHVPVP